jgi:hypothetical protein
LKVVILQPSYIPWRGYFHQIHKADVFVFYDCVQYDDRGWRNRNLLKAPSGSKWLTVPVRSKGCQSDGLKIADVPIVWDADWTKKHIETIRHLYSKAPFFQYYQSLFGSLFSRRDELLVDLTCDTTVQIARELGIAHTRFLRSSSLPAEGTKTDRLLSILRHLGATHYISGPSAKSYIELDKFAEAGISVEFIRYEYPDYEQQHGVFVPQVSVLDLMLNVGPNASKYIWG